MKNWFDSWFDTKYYHILYKNRNYTEAENFIKNLTADLTIDPNKSILDLACGKGRHSIFLNKLGYTTTGVDLSKESIQHASQFETDTLDFFVHDMRKQIKNKSFDYVFNLFTSIGYFEDELDNLKMLNSIDSYTTKNGVLVIDFMNAHKVVTNLVLDEVKVIDGLTFNINRKLENGFIIKTISFTDNKQDFIFQEKVQALQLEDFENYLKETNFSIYKVVGDYNLGNFDLEKSNRLIIFAKK
jgi:SAM-dependent methyltransferase